MDEATILEIPQLPPVGGISSRGSKRRFIQNIPRGGIQAVLRIRSTVNVDCDTYSTHPVQKIVSIRLTSGATTQPKRANRIWDSDGIYRESPKLKRVRITPCTIPNVMRIA